MRPYSIRTPALFVVLAAATAACAATTPGAQPHDMSAAQHTQMAANEAQTGELHAAQYDPRASTTAQRCSPNPNTDATGACWTSTSNPTREHLEEAKKHEKMAADHRAASQALRDAEARACVGLSDEDREMSPFEHREDIAAVEPLTVSASTTAYSTYGTTQSTRTEGAVITFRALPGMTTQWLQRVVDCHLARNAALGHDVPEMPTCPLVPKGATATVAATGAGFAVAVRSDNPDTAKEILRRAQALVGRR